MEYNYDDNLERKLFALKQEWDFLLAEYTFPLLEFDAPYIVQNKIALAQ